VGGRDARHKREDDDLGTHFFRLFGRERRSQTTRDDIDENLM
jgi:hypothetical protein